MDWPGGSRPRGVESAGVRFPKENAVRSEPYRRLIAALPCARCGIVGYSQAAHPPTTGKGIKQDDRLCIPLCCDRPELRGCHTLIDQYILMPHDETVAWVLDKAREIRTRIIRAGLWPRNLPTLP